MLELSVPRGGSRPGAGRPRKPIEQHLAEGTYRASRHRRWIAPPLVAPPPKRPPPPEAHWRELTGDRHFRFTSRQLELIRFGPAVAFEQITGSSLNEMVASWLDWNRAFGLRYRLQNECPKPADAADLADQRGVERLSAAELVAIVDKAVASFDATIPDPPPWDKQAARALGGAWREGALIRVGCGGCGARVLLLPATVAAAIPARNIARVRAALAALSDGGYRYALAGPDRHFPCPACGNDQYIPDEAEMSRL